ncbi:PDZ domain-containing protein [Soonwooa sp.]|uniref:PDZ domain-containing protein n=1 Tax=Soonwooa sp. TaxID=1938592 RepID=UPI002627E6A5|nr:PDZ domain-containing protein [Soonwooa sp.]
MKSFITFVFLNIQILLFAQSGFQFYDSKVDKVEIKFVNVNNLIIIPININSVPLNFLVDTGVSETVLFSLDNKKVNFNNVEKIKFSGLGENIDIEALKSINNIFNIDDKFIDRGHKLNIILNEDFNISPSLGYSVNGIIGYELFKNYPIEIDYVSQKLIIYNSQKKFNNRIKKFEDFDLSIELNKPYMFADVEMTHEKKSSKLLLDSGNADSVWLFPTLIPGFNYNRPNIDDYLGAGFSGDIYGKRSRIHGLYFGNFEFKTPLVAMPDPTSIAHLQLVPNRKGSIGAEIIRRFNTIFDYSNKKVYFKKNKYYDDPFLFDLSGIEVRQDGMSWEQDLVKVETKKQTGASDDNISGRTLAYKAQDDFQYKFTLKPKFVIAGTRKDSPAQLAGLQKADVLVKIDNQLTSNMTLSKINKILKSQEGKDIKIEILRNELPMTFNIKLKDPIPYEEQ